MNNIKSSLIALTLVSVTTIANAASLAITNATVHTVSDQGVLTNATVVVENGKISAINPESFAADTVIDAQGKILTPGLIGSINQLGLVEVSAVSSSKDASASKADITFDASLAFNPKTTVIPFARKGGVTSNVVVPRGGDSYIKGQIFTVKLTGEFESVLKSNHGVLIELGAKRKGSRAYDFQQLSNKLADAKEKLVKADKKKDKKDDKKSEHKRDEKIINALLAGEKPMLAYVDRASDILSLLKLKETYGINIVIVSGEDAVVVAKEIAAANVPVVMNPMSNLPGSFDSLHNSLDNAAKLVAAGVKVVFAGSGDTHNLYQLRYSAGNAVSNGLSKADALAAVTKNVADVFDINAGQISVGKSADLVLWSADPFELSSSVEHLWINGKEYSTKSRHDALRDRYTTDSSMPRAYTK